MVNICGRYKVFLGGDITVGDYLTNTPRHKQSMNCFNSTGKERETEKDNEKDKDKEEGNERVRMKDKEKKKMSVEWKGNGKR